MTTTMPPESSSAVVLHATTTATTATTTANTCEYYDDNTMYYTTTQEEEEEVDEYSSCNPMRRIAHHHNESSALDALAALAAASDAVSHCPAEEPASHHLPDSTSTTLDGNDDDADAECMPPPPPRRNPMAMLAASAAASSCEPSSTSSVPYDYPSSSSPSSPSIIITNSYIGGGRLRSASNPEGMEKWDLYSHRNDRQHFVLPSSILEEELASTRRVLGEIVDESYGIGSNNDEYMLNSLEALQSSSSTGSTTKAAKGGRNIGKGVGGFLQHHSTKRTSRLGTSPDSVLGLEDNNSNTKSTKNSYTSSCGGSSSNAKSRKKSTRSPSPSDIIINSPPSDEDDEANLEPEELLRRARARLLEDLSEGGDGSNGVVGGVNADNKTSVLILPHSLTKYKEVYNKNGRIGVYTPAERAAIIHKFNAKRARRVWNKKIRYNCRKNLADRRMRVKGRFVKRGTEAAGGGGGGDSPPPPEDEEEEEDDEVKQWATKKTGTKGGVKARPASRSSSSPFSGSPLCTVNEEDEEGQPMDEDMPDVEDEDAGFEPSEDMPFRRPRRYTIT